MAVSLPKSVFRSCRAALRRDVTESCNSTASGSAAIYGAFRESASGNVPMRWHRARAIGTA
jgi:hypothetical protein